MDGLGGLKAAGIVSQMSLRAKSIWRHQDYAKMNEVIGLFQIRSTFTHLYFGQSSRVEGGITGCDNEMIEEIIAGG